VSRVFRPADEPRSRRLSRSTLIRLGAAALALGGMGVAMASQVSKLSTIDWSFSPGWLLAGIAGFIALQYFMCILWLRLVRRLGGELPTPRGRSIWCTSVLGRYVPTGALMIVGRIDMARRAGVPRRITTASIVYELAFTLGGALVVCAAFIVGLQDLAPAPVRLAAPVVGVAAIVGLHPRIFGPVSSRLLARAGREPLPQLLSARDVALFALGYIVSFVMAGLATIALALALHPVSVGDTPLVVSSFAVGFAASLVGFLSPGGLGAREVAQATALAAALPFAVGLAVALLTRLAQMAVELAFAATMPVLERHGLARIGRPTPGAEL
jgi:hypothetical protein